MKEKGDEGEKELSKGGRMKENGKGKMKGKNKNKNGLVEGGRIKKKGEKWKKKMKEDRRIGKRRKREN